MNTIYIVTDGCYSDYGIRAVFSTREKAQAFIDEHAAPWDGPGRARPLDDPSIEEWDMDGEDPPEKCQRFCVVLAENGDTVFVATTNRVGGPLRQCESFRWSGWPGELLLQDDARAAITFHGTLWATDADHAIKSARDRRAASRAAGELEAHRALFTGGVIGVAR